MNVSILTLFPELYNTFLDTSLIGRAREKGIIQAQVNSFFEFCAQDKRIDAPTFGHGTGVLLRPDVVADAIDAQEKLYGKALKIFFSPQGKKLTQPYVRELAHTIQSMNPAHVICVASRYEGMDARVEELYADEVVSIGDYVLMGGDLPTMVLLEALLRHVPGVVGKLDSVEKDSFTGAFVDYPEYTVPVEWRGMMVPAVVRSGNHGAVDAWRHEQAVRNTVLRHFEWVRSQALSPQDRADIQACMPKHYVVLMHDEVRLKSHTAQELVGTTSVTTLDIHDIARSSLTYGLESFFLVTSLLDQQRVVGKLLDFWLKEGGQEYNYHRYQAVSRVQMLASLDEVVAAITKLEGLEPVLIATTARVDDASSAGTQLISYHDQAVVWGHNRPVLLVLGTGHGLATQILKRADYILMPLEGISDFNHLSVRSAAAVIFDRWLGLQPR